MTARADSFTLLSRRMRKSAPLPAIEEMPSIAEALMRVDRAIEARRAA